MRSTLVPGCSLSRAASTQPAEPAPTMTKSYNSALRSEAVTASAALTWPVPGRFSFALSQTGPRYAACTRGICSIDPYQSFYAPCRITEDPAKQRLGYHPGQRDSI